MEWQPIKTAPKETRVIVANGVEFVSAELRDFYPWTWILSPMTWVGDGETGELERLDFTPTHWMIPDLPTKDK